MAEPAWAIWVTGLPASGKSTVTAALAGALAGRGIEAAVLESDVVRRVLTPRPTYDATERDDFYAALLWVGTLLVRHGVPVVFDATANRRAYRAAARDRLARFLEVHVRTPLAECVERDPKGIYARGRDQGGDRVPGLGADYEAPEAPEVVIDGRVDDPATGARRIVEALETRGWI